jgi:hypothetical protein
MKSLRNRLFAIAAVALVVVFASAVPAAAQSAYQGSFTLPREVRWQNVTLPAGDYTFDLKSLATPSRITVKGPNGSVFIAAVVADEKASERSMLIIENHGSRSIVSELRLSGLSRTLRYAVPKDRKDAEVAQGPVTREEILVAVSVK